MRPRKLLRIARWEVTKNAGSLDQRTVTIGVAILAVLMVAGPVVALGGLGFDDGIYRVGVDESSPYYDAVASDDTFVPVTSGASEDLADGSIEILVEETANGTTIQRGDSQKAEAAFTEFRQTVREYNDDRLAGEDNQTAAFPVYAILDFQQRSAIADLLEERRQQRAVDSGPANDTDGNATNESDTGNESVRDDLDGDEESSGSLGQFGAPLSGNVLSGTPAAISPPFPFQSLLLALVFVVPLNFLIQIYGSAMLSERINRRGQLLLVSPVSRLDIIGGKTLPYFAGAMLLEGGLVLALFYLVNGALGGLLSIFALTPLVMLFLGLTFLASMFARSFRELTFLTLTITVLLTTYAFVPAIFSDINEIALISPLTLVVRDLQGQTVELSGFLFTTTPPLLVAGICFALGAGLFREEDMFAQRSLSGRLIDSLAGPVVKRWHVGAMTGMLLPVVLVAQMFAITLLLVPGDLPGNLLLWIMFSVVAVTEELAKSLHVYAAYEHERFRRAVPTALVLGAISGIGFFLGENLVLLAQLAGLPELSVGEASVLGGTMGGPILLSLLVVPLALHIGTAAISAVGASRGKRQYAVCLTVAMVVHLAYNLAVVSLLA